MRRRCSGRSWRRRRSGASAARTCKARSWPRTRAAARAGIGSRVRRRCPSAACAFRVIARLAGCGWRRRKFAHRRCRGRPRRRMRRGILQRRNLRSFAQPGVARADAHTASACSSNSSAFSFSAKAPPLRSKSSKPTPVRTFRLYRGSSTQSRVQEPLNSRRSALRSGDAAPSRFACRPPAPSQQALP